GRADPPVHGGTMLDVSAPVTSLAEQLGTALGHAIATAYPDAGAADPLIRPSDHADLQANGALALAKRVGAPPREVAAALVRALETSGESADLRSEEHTSELQSRENLV